jgi:PAS domain S-box-containing protein
MKEEDFSYDDYLSGIPESGKFIYLVMENFPQGIVISDTEDRIVYANFKIARLTGYSRKEMIGKNASHFLHLPKQQSRLKISNEQDSPGNYESYELLVKRRGASPFHGHIMTTLYKSPEGRVMGTINIITDMTIEKREAELEALAIAATKTINSVIITDRFGKIEWVNEGFTSLSGYHLFEVIDTKGEALRKEHPVFMNAFEKAVSGKCPVAFEYLNIDKTGQPYFVKSTITPLFDEAGDVKEVIIIETDISEYREEKSA